MPLTDTRLRALKPKDKPYKVTDERGLYVEVTPTGSKLWRFRYRIGGAQKKLCIGSYPEISLKQARDAAYEARRAVASGADPAFEKRKRKIRAEFLSAQTFEAVAREYIEQMMVQNGRADGTIVKANYFLDKLAPAIGNRPINEIEPFEVLAPLKRLEATGKHETAKKCRSFAGRVFRYGVATTRCKSDPTSMLKGALVTPRATHYAAILEPTELGGLLRAIDDFTGYMVTKLALQIAPHVFVRPGELRHAEWHEIDLVDGVWKIPAGKMKARRAHAVPLSKQVRGYLTDLAEMLGREGYVFPSARSSKRPMSENTLNAAFRRMGYSKEEVTAHGLRATASTFLNESGLWNPDAIERALPLLFGKRAYRSFERVVELGILPDRALPDIGEQRSPVELGTLEADICNARRTSRSASSEIAMTQNQHEAQESGGKKGSISLTGAVAMGTGVMIGAGIFALTGQIAELAGPLFPLSFIAGAIVTALAAYSYIKMSNALPSSGGIAMILQKAYGPGTVAAAASLLMALSMVINESLVARTFATYALRPFGMQDNGILQSALALGLIVFAYLVNASGNRSVSMVSIVMSAIKIGGIAIFAVAALWVSGLSGGAFAEPTTGFGWEGTVASVAFSILAFKGFTTITNSGGEIVDPHRNVGRTIMIAIGICVVTYLLVAGAVGASLGIEEIVAARDYSLAAAAEPALGRVGFWFTIVIALTATASGVVASVFAVSRMLTMLTKMKMIPHSHFGMRGSLRSHLLVYTVVVAGVLAVLFDLSRIAALGVFFYLVMDMLVHWGVLRNLRKEIGARAEILLAALAADLVVLGAFTWIKLQSDAMIVLNAVLGIAIVFFGEHLFLRRMEADEDELA